MARDQEETSMSKHDEKLGQKSPAKPAIKKERGALDENDLERVTGGITFNYGSLAIKYTPQKSDGTIEKQ
jgi:hypothetical protein